MIHPNLSVFLALAVSVIGVSDACGQAAHEVETAKAWQALARNGYAEAIKHAKNCALQFGDAARRLEKRLADANAATPNGKVTEEQKEAIFANISQRAASMIREDLEAMGPVRLSEVEAAQLGIVKAAFKLQEEGQISMPGRGGDDVLV